MDIEQKLIKYNKEAEKARKGLSKIHGVDIESFEIQVALEDHLNLENSIEIISKDLDASEMVEILRDHDFSKPDKLTEIILKETIIPKGIPRLLTEAEIKAKGEKWILYKYDKDPFPSNPHAHNYEANVKLHLGNGKLYGKKRNLVGKISKKILLDIREKIKGKIRDILLPPLSD